jgi:hypothetical protein
LALRLQYRTGESKTDSRERRQAGLDTCNIRWVSRAHGRSQRRGAITGKGTTNADVYLVASKTITYLRGLPILLNGGVRGTNAELWGMAGNATRFQARQTPDWKALLQSA